MVGGGRADLGEAAAADQVDLARHCPRGMLVQLPRAIGALGRVAPIRRPPRVTEPASVPCRYPGRPGLCLPPGPHSHSASSANMAAITWRPAPTARASRPSFTDPAISAIDTAT